MIYVCQGDEPWAGNRTQILFKNNGASIAPQAGDNPQAQGIIVALSKGGSDKYGVSNPQGDKGKINILSSPIYH